MNKSCAVIMSVYANDKYDYFKTALESVFNQTIELDMHIYLCIDGYISSITKKYIDLNKYRIYKVIKNTESYGLAYSLNLLINSLEDEEYVFRMDSDDICFANRFKKQIDFLKLNQDIDICGTSICEFSDNIKNYSVRNYPRNNKDALNEIHKATIFAHPTVCFRRTFLEKGYLYKDTLLNSQDIELWFRVLKDNIQIANIPESLLFFRLNNSFFKRRSFEKAKNEYIIYTKGIFSLFGVSYKLAFPCLRFILRLFPSKIQQIAYKIKNKYLGK